MTLRPQPKIHVKISMELSSRRVAKAVYESVNPDNTGVPECLKLDMLLCGKRIEVSADSSCKVNTLISTVDDLLKACQVSLEGIVVAGEA